jgi:hypothetical protein
VRLVETIFDEVAFQQAKDESSAIRIVKQMYRNEDIALDSTDFIDTEIELLPA